MTILFVLLPVSFALAAVAVASFIWSVRRGQLDDLETPALRILMDDDEPLRRQPAHPAAAATSRLAGNEGAGHVGQ